MQTYVVQSHFLLAMPVFLAGTGLLYLLSSSRRSNRDVLEDLGQAAPSTEGRERSTKPCNDEGSRLPRQNSRDEVNLNFLTSEQRRRLRQLQQFLILGGGFTGLLLSSVLGSFTLLRFFVFGAIGAFVGYLISRQRIRSVEQQFKRDLVFFLPVVMERVVMAVQAGLDIVPALNLLRELEKPPPALKSWQPDPVTRLFGRVCQFCEAGMSFEQALRETAATVNSSALRHAFIHLGVAQKEGGELVYPLRELSDATQLHYQEAIEEDIAKMPIKATLPLLITFAGLILFFLIAPMIQILQMMQNYKPH